MRSILLASVAGIVSAFFVQPAAAGPPLFTVDGLLGAEPYTPVAPGTNSGVGAPPPAADLFALYCGHDGGALHIFIEGYVAPGSPLGMALFIDVSGPAGMPLPAAMGSEPGAAPLLPTPLVDPAAPGWSWDFAEVDLAITGTTVGGAGTFNVAAARYTPGGPTTGISQDFGDITDGGAPMAVPPAPGVFLAAGSVLMANFFSGGPGTGWEIAIPFAELPAIATDAVTLGVIFFDTSTSAGVGHTWLDISAPGVVAGGPPGPGAVFSVVPTGPYFTPPKLLPVELSAFSLE